MAERQRYKIQEKINAGGMAEIYKAFAVTLDGFEKPVAIKRILPSLSSQPKFVNMFLDEARLSMHLNHANIVQVFDVGRAQGAYFIVMELVEGHNLRQIFQRLSEVGLRFPVPVALYVASEMLKGLAHAHERRDNMGNLLGIVHRDVSPPNILISHQGEVKVADFGLAKATSQAEITDPGVVKGKFSYLSPEALDGRAIDHRADIFAAGILLWELLANRRLFLGVDEQETVQLVQEMEIPSLALLNPDVPEELDRMVLKALNRDPRKRWISAREMSDALTDYLFSKGLKASNFELAEFLRSVFEHHEVLEEGINHERIQALIQEEILSLSVIRYAGQPLPVEGATPILLDTMSRLGSGRISQDDLMGRAAISDGRRPATQSMAIVDLLEGRETVPMVTVGPPPPKERHLAVWIVAGVLAAAALATGGYFLWTKVIAG
ncbi:MAG: serine/threonine protein kinase [Myxococcota bacterium]|jgi:serine/threonine protein kinase|nr:serine/threonine-protein kinase [Myxococcota bacterium]HON24667.1 serine/threonine-protein kinase [Myxococcota bacterium]HOS60794.1 serine/threonine-protein kinase [Myxococcota bacterium]HPC90822.1 serine/threonine-protein kinase [Myxococcota bacterium]HPL24438.1 serine/threonine-protein kinase [Myxococcota bacterium]